MHLNKTLFYIHRFFIFFYIALFVVMFAAYFLHRLTHYSMTTLGLVGVIYIGLAFLHFKASQGVALGTQKGRILSLLLSFITLLGFPLGTIIGVIMLFFLTPKRWQTPSI
nr:hypothetical protein [Acinetobacter sp. Marseille-Q1620]